MIRRLFEEAILVEPRHGPTYNAYGNFEWKQRGNTTAARQIYKRGIHARCSDLASVYHGYAKFELSLGNADAARILLEEGLDAIDNTSDQSTRNPTTSTSSRVDFLSHSLGMLHLNSNRAADAKRVFLAALERNSTSSQLLLGAALCELKLGNEERARSLLRDSLRADKHHVQACHAWASMEVRAGNTQEATTLFEYGLEIAPTYGSLWCAYATMESRLGRSTKARALFLKGVKQCPNHNALYQAWACLEMRCGNFKSAKRLVSEALTRDKTNGKAWLVAATIEERQEQAGLAQLILQRGLEHAPHCPQLYDKLGGMLVSTSKIQQARETFERGLEVDPTHAPLYHSLAELEARVCNVQGLADLHRRASNIFNPNALEPPATSTLGATIFHKSSSTSRTSTSRTSSTRTSSTTTRHQNYYNNNNWSEEEKENEQDDAADAALGGVVMDDDYYDALFLDS